MCTWLKNAKKCIVKGTEDQYEDVYNPASLGITQACDYYTAFATCPTDTCVWIDDEGHPDGGTCEDKPTEEPSGDERRARESNPQDETAQVNINLKALTSANTPVQGHLRCK